MSHLFFEPLVPEYYVLSYSCPRHYSSIPPKSVNPAINMYKFLAWLVCIKALGVTSTQHVIFFWDCAMTVTLSHASSSEVSSSWPSCMMNSIVHPMHTFFTLISYTICVTFAVPDLALHLLVPWSSNTAH